MSVVMVSAHVASRHLTSYHHAEKDLVLVGPIYECWMRDDHHSAVGDDDAVDLVDLSHNDYGDVTSHVEVEVKNSPLRRAESPCY